MAEIVRRYGPEGPRDLVGDPALITDDTRMTLAVARAMPVVGPLDPGAVETALREQFVEWLDSPENNPCAGHDVPARVSCWRRASRGARRRGRRRRAAARTCGWRRWG